MGYPPYGYNVFLNGKHIKNCLDYDVKEGYVKYYELDASGKIQMEGSQAKIVTARGKVEIKSMWQMIEEMA